VKNARAFPVYLAVFAVLLALSIHGVIWIPKWSFRGLDLQNLHAFHTQCPGWPIPYDRTGAECGDSIGRAMVYPPLLYWAMGWTRLVSFPLATVLWSIAIPVLTLAGVAITARADLESRPSRAALPAWKGALGLLFLLQMPMAYAVERGNNDALVLPVYAFAILLFVREKLLLAGVVLAVACWLKIYPAVPVALLLGALALSADRRRLEALLTGLSMGGLTIAILTLPDSWTYATEVLPAFAAQKGGFGTSSHTLFRSWGGLAFKLAMIAYWCVFTRRALPKDPVLVLAAGLAIATFFPSVTNDYNLITAYPFLWLVLDRLLRPGMSGGDFAMLLLTFLAFVGDRTPLETVLPNRSALLAQAAWFVAFPAFLVARIGSGKWAPR
jgi:hypothetical protein